MADWYPALPQPYVKPMAERGIMPLALGAQVGINMADSIGQMQMRQAALDQYRASQAAAKEYAATGNLNAYRAVDPKGAAVISAADQQQAFDFWDKMKWMVTPENWNSFRGMALEKFGPRAEGMLPKNYPGENWLRQQEDYVVNAKMKMQEWREKIARIKADIEADKRDDNRRLTDARIANIGSQIENRGIRTGILKDKADKPGNKNVTPAELDRRAAEELVRDKGIPFWQALEIVKNQKKTEKSGGLAGLLEEKRKKGEAGGKPSGGAAPTIPTGDGVPVVGGMKASDYKKSSMITNRSGESYITDGKVWIPKSAPVKPAAPAEPKAEPKAAPEQKGKSDKISKLEELKKLAKAGKLTDEDVEAAVREEG